MANNSDSTISVKPCASSSIGSHVSWYHDRWLRGIMAVCRVPRTSVPLCACTAPLIMPGARPLPPSRPQYLVTERATAIQLRACRRFIAERVSRSPTVIIRQLKWYGAIFSARPVGVWRHGGVARDATSSYRSRERSGDGKGSETLGCRPDAARAVQSHLYS